LIKANNKYGYTPLRVTLRNGMLEFLVSSRKYVVILIGGIINIPNSKNDTFSLDNCIELC